MNKYLSAKIYFLPLIILGSSDLFAIFNFATQLSEVRLSGANASLSTTTTLDISGKLSLRDNSANIVSGSNINFNNGILQSGQMSTIFTGVYNSTGTDEIGLTGNCNLDVQAGDVNFPVKVSGTGNTIYGRPRFSQDITLLSSADSLSMGIQTDLPVNLNLTGGSLSLSSDLVFSESARIVGPGTIDLNSNKLGTAASSTTWTENVTFTGIGAINLNSSINISNCTWTFGDSAGFTVINGNGHTITLGANGKISIANNFYLLLQNVHLKGLGDGATDGKILVGNAASTVAFDGSIIDLINDYTVSNGNFYMLGTNCTLFCKTFLFNINSTGLLTIDGVALIWDKLSISNDSNPIIPATNANLQLLNSGLIRSLNSSLAPTYFYSTSSSLASNIDVTTSSNLVFTNSTPLVPKLITLSGSGHYIHFSRSDLIQNFIIEDNLTVTLSNVVLKDFNPNCISFGTNSSLVLGDDVTIELGKDVILASPLTVSGNVSILGGGGRLVLQHANSLVINGNGKSLTLQNLVLEGPGGAGSVSGIERIRVTNATASLTLKDVEVVLDGTYEHSEGSVYFDGNVKIAGPGKVFTITSAEQSSVLAKSSLTFDTGVTFSYAGTGVNNRTRFALSDPTSVLKMNGSTLHSTHTGLILDTGSLHILDAVTLRSVAGVDEGPYGHTVPAVGEEPVLKSTLSVKIMSGAVLEVDGNIVCE